MRFRLTIGRKLYFGFGVFILGILIVFVLTNQTLNQSREINDRINRVYIPSVEQLERLRYEIIRTRMLITNWAFVQSREDTQEKRSLVQITNEDLPEILGEINKLSNHWIDEEVRKMNALIAEINELLEMYEVVKNELPDMRSYDEDFNVFYARDYAEEGGVIDTKAKEILFNLENVILKMRRNTEVESNEMLASFEQLKVYLRYFGIGLIISGTLIALLTGRSIVKPVKELRNTLVSMGKGVVPEERVKITNDEIGEMGIALNNLMDGFKQTTNFAGQVGKGNFEYPYKPLSAEDKLGEALVKMAKQLGANERELEQKVRERTQEVVLQSERINELYTDITASIRYAKRLQQTILPPETIIKSMFPNSFIQFRPKDIVSGDFYFFKNINGKKVFAAVDCTGHGVPGAFMSLVGFNGLNQAVRENNNNLKVDKILHDFHKLAQENLNKTNEYHMVRDSMDMALCIYDETTGELEYSGAKIPLYLVRNNKLIEYKPNKFSIGSMEHGEVIFEKHTIAIEPEDKIYLFSDGFVDQFGGVAGKKFKYNQFRRMIISTHQLPMEEQKNEYNLRLDTWKEGYEQVDDILFVGIGF